MGSIANMLANYDVGRNLAERSALEARTAVEQAQVPGIAEDTRRRQLENQIRERDLRDQEITRRALINTDGSQSGIARYVVQNGISATGFQGLQSHWADMRTKIAAADEKELANFRDHMDQVNGMVEAVKKLPTPDAQAAGYAGVYQRLSPELQKQLPPQFPGVENLTFLQSTFRPYSKQVADEMKKREVAAAEKTASARGLTATTGATKTAAELPGIEAKGHIEELTLKAMQAPQDPAGWSALVDKMGAKPEHGRAVKAEIEFATTHPTPDDPTGAKRAQQAIQNAQIRIGQEEGARLSAGLRLMESHERAALNRADRSYTFNQRELDQIGKPVESAATRLSEMRDILASGNPQADALVAPKLLTAIVSGYGTGIRVTQAEINTVTGGATHWQNLQRAINKWSLNPDTAVIPDEQRHQIRGLLDLFGRKVEAKQAALHQAAQELATTDDVAEHRNIVSRARQAVAEIEQRPAAATGVIRARDLQGKLHEAPAGTPLPAGWKLEK